MPQSVINVISHPYLAWSKRETRGATLRNAADQGRIKNVQNRKDNFDDCRLGVDCPVHCPARRRLGAPRPNASPPDRIRSIPPQQCLCGTRLRCGATGVAWLRLLWLLLRRRLVARPALILPGS